MIDENNFEKKSKLKDKVDETFNEKEIIKSKNIICPKCHEPCKIKIENYKFKLYDCVNKHITDNIRIKDFKDTQKINKSNIFCEQENDRNNDNTNKNELNKFIQEKETNDNKFSEIKRVIDTFINDIKKMIEKLNDLMEIMNIYYQINEEIFNNYDINNTNNNKNENYKEIFNNNDLINELKEINKIKFLKNKFEKMIDVYYKISSLNIMTIIYKIENRNQDRLYLFSENFIGSFVDNNKDKSYILIDGEKYDLCGYHYLNENQKSKNTLEIKLIEDKPITNMSNIFRGCTSLISLPDISNWNFKNINNMTDMFESCISLISLPDISNWDTTNVIGMGGLFENCNNLISLPDISKWNTKNVTNMKWMFRNCKSLKSLPDISKWDTSNVKTMYSMFEGCESLISLPDISKWKTKNVTNMQTMFNDCKSLISFPNLSEWDLNKELHNDFMFWGVDEKIIPKKFKH